MRNLARSLALTGAFSALVVVLGITRLGFIPLGAASLTILHIPVILIVMLCGLPEGLFVGAAFGIFSLIQAAMSSAGGLDPLFVNPLCSVLPRMLLAVAAWGLWKLSLKYRAILNHMLAFVAAIITGVIIWKLVNSNVSLSYEWKINYIIIGSVCISRFVWVEMSKLSKTISNVTIAGVTAFVATVIHTALVIGSLYLFQFSGMKEAMGGTGYGILMLALLPNACMEAAAATIICAAVYGALFVAKGRKSKLSEEE